MQFIEVKHREWPLLALKVRVMGRYWTLNRPASSALQAADNIRLLIRFRIIIRADNFPKDKKLGARRSPMPIRESGSNRKVSYSNCLRSQSSIRYWTLNEPPSSALESPPKSPRLEKGSNLNC